MKFINFLFFLIIFQFIIAKSSQFEITPLQINFIGIEAKGDTVITYGDYGSMLISYDNAETWEQLKVFENHLILKIYWNDDKIIAVNNKGQVAESYDKFKKWNLIYDINEQIEAISESKDGYFVRTPDKVLLLDSNFNKISESKLISPPLPLTFKFQYRRSVAYFKNYYYVAIDSARFIKYDKQLAVIDTLDMPKIFGTTKNSMYEIDIIENNYLFRLGNTIFTTSDFSSIDVVYNIKSNGFYKFIDTEMKYLLYSTDQLTGTYIGPLRLYDLINKDSLFQVSGVYRVKETIVRFAPKDFTIINDKIVIIGDNKLILSLNQNDSLLKLNSYFYANSEPDKIGSNNYLFYQEVSNGSNLGQISSTSDNGVTFQSIYNYEYSNPNSLNRILYHYYDANFK